MGFVEDFSVLEGFSVLEDFSVLAGAAFSEVAAVDVLDFSAVGVSLEVDADESLDDDSDFVACLRASEG